MKTKTYREILWWIDIEYINFSPNDAIKNYFPEWIAPDVDEDTKNTDKCYNELSISSSSLITHTCGDYDTGPYLSFDSISWNNYFVLDIKTESFLSGIAQKIITKILNNDQQKLKIVLYFDSNAQTEKGRNKLKKFVVEIFNFFNQIEDTSKMICLECKIRSQNNQDIYLEGMNNLKTKIFSDIEIWQCIEPRIDDENHSGNWKVWKWEE